MLSKENYYALLEHYISSAEYWKREWFDDLVGGHTNTTCSFENYWEFKKKLLERLDPRRESGTFC